MALHRALRRLADILRATIRDGDVLGRLGGEEFGVLLPGTPADVAQRIAERIRAAVQERSGGDGVPPFTVSIGVATTAAGTDSWEAADRALYAAKLAGRNRVLAAGEAPVITGAPVIEATAA